MKPPIMPDPQENPLKVDWDSFPEISKKDWIAIIEKDLKGKPLKSLVWNPAEGFAIEPFYTAEEAKAGHLGLDGLPGFFPFRRGNRINSALQAWKIVEEIPADSADLANRMSEGIASETGGYSLRAGEKGFPDTALPAFVRAAGDKDISLFLFPASGADVLDDRIFSTVRNSGLSPASLQGAAFYDPVSAALLGHSLSLEDHAVSLKTIFGYSPFFRGMGMDLSHIPGLGGHSVHELAFGLGILTEYLDRFGEYGLSPAQLLQGAAVHLAVDARFFIQLAKFRAFRILFARVAEAFDVHIAELQSPYILARTSPWNQTIPDPYNNLLRGTTEAMSAIFGGCQGLIVTPFNAATGESGNFAARLSRNIQLLLKYESGLDRVSDPAGGSWYAEELTDSLAQESWKLFQQIEKEGGFLESIRKGMIPEMLASSAAQKEKAISERKQPVVGVNKYPDQPEKTQFPETPVGQDGALRRDTAFFESLRQKVEKRVKSGLKRPAVFIFTFGDLSMRAAREQFSRELFGLAACEAIRNPEPDHSEKAISVITEYQPEFIVLCSGNDAYLDIGKEMITHSRAASPASNIYIAGKFEGVDSLGADGYIFAGMDVFEFLSSALDPIL